MKASRSGWGWFLLLLLLWLVVYPLVLVLVDSFRGPLGWTGSFHSGRAAISCCATS